MAKPAPRKGKAVARPPTMRLLPALIFVAALMLSVRGFDLWKGLSGLGSLRVASELEAEQPPRGKGPEAKGEEKTAKATGGEDKGEAKGKTEAEGKPAATTAPPATETAATPTEMDVLEKLSERRDQLDARERDIQKREALLKAGEDQIDRRVAELKTLQSTIEGLLRQYNEQEDNKMKSLVKIYENMKPKEAAKIFEQLDMAILLDVIERMKEQKVAPILAEMDPAKARTVTSEMAQRRQMPLPKCTTGG